MCLAYETLMHPLRKKQRLTLLTLLNAHFCADIVCTRVRPFELIYRLDGVSRIYFVVLEMVMTTVSQFRLWKLL